MTASLTSVVIDPRFAGPPSSANGGYTSGLLAELMSAPDAAVTVTLRRPPPLAHPLDVVSHLPTTDGPSGPPIIRLLDGDVVVAEAGAGSLQHEAVEPVSPAAALAAHAGYRGLVDHPFPTCFVCGPARTDGDGMRLSPGLVGPGRTACTWRPHATLAGQDGQVARRFVWAALDCPGGWTSDLQARPLVLGRMTAVFDLPVSVGSSYVVVARLIGQDGRKTFTASTLYEKHRRVVARAEHTWIAIDPAQFG